MMVNRQRAMAVSSKRQASRTTRKGQYASNGVHGTNGRLTPLDTYANINLMLLPKLNILARGKHGCRY